MSNLGFLRRGSTIACLKGGGTISDTRDSLMMAVMMVIKSSRHACTRYVGTGSKACMTSFGL